MSIAEIPIESAGAVAAGQSTEDRAEFLRNHSKAFIFGATILVFWILAAIFGNLLVPHNPLVQNPSNINQAPTLSHWFGTDSLGRDMFARVITASRDILIIAPALASSPSTTSGAGSRPSQRDRPPTWRLSPFPGIDRSRESRAGRADQRRSRSLP